MASPNGGVDDASAASNATPLLYSLIRLIFRAAGFIFYATTECHGVEDFPAAGQATLLCFNHGNGLADPLCLIKATPRMVRFCAKDTLWSVPGMKYFIRNSGAVPIYRAKEHGDQARSRLVRLDGRARRPRAHPDRRGPRARRPRT